MNDHISAVVSRLSRMGYDIRESDVPYSANYIHSAHHDPYSNLTVHYLVEFGYFTADTCLGFYTPDGWDMYYLAECKHSREVGLVWDDVKAVLTSLA